MSRKIDTRADLENELATIKQRAAEFYRGVALDMFEPLVRLETVLLMLDTLFEKVIEAVRKYDDQRD